LTGHKRQYTYDYPKADVTVDAVVFGIDRERPELRVLLVRRASAPYAKHYALPGGFIRMGESLERAVRRELREETAITPRYLEQLYTFGDCGRDPRGRVISVAYLALVRMDDHHPIAASDALAVAWHPVGKLPKLAFDHDAIVDWALSRLRAKVRYAPVGFDLLPEEFPLSAVHRLYEIVTGMKFDLSNFRKRLLATGVVVPTGETRTIDRAKATLYRVDQAAYADAHARGFNFEL